MKAKKQVVLITGCSSGIGEALSREFHKKNCHVIATARNLASLASLLNEGIETRQLDINNSEEVDFVIKDILKERGQIDILVNNAGYGLMGPMIELGHEQLSSQFETNVFSPLMLIQKIVPNMRNMGSGLIVNIGSISGVVTTPFSGAYCASKSALHSFSDALRMELMPLGIRVITVQPGAIVSHFGDAATLITKNNLKSDSWYAPIQDKIIGRANVSQIDATPTDVFAIDVVKKLLGSNPPEIIRLGKKSTLLPLLKRLLPTSVLDNILNKKFGLNEIKPNSALNGTIKPRI